MICLRKLGFNDTSDEAKITRTQNQSMGELRRVFKPEFLNRVDDIIVFHSLKEEEIKKIAENMLGTLIERMRQNGINVEFSKDTLEMLVKEGFDPAYGARPLRRVIQSKIEDFLAEQMLEGKVKAGDSIKLDTKDGKVIVA